MGKPAGGYLNSARAVLQAARRPMTTQEITAEATRLGLLRPAGKTPEATMSAALYIHTRDVPTAAIVRLHDAGPTRARRGSARWVWRETGQ
jgi:hypothetical protein